MEQSSRPLSQRIQSIVFEFDDFHHELEIEPDITIITGPNGFGKSLLFEALYAAGTPGAPEPVKDYHLCAKLSKGNEYLLHGDYALSPPPQAQSYSQGIHVVRNYSPMEVCTLLRNSLIQPFERRLGMFLKYVNERFPRGTLLYRGRSSFAGAISTRFTSQRYWSEQPIYPSGFSEGEWRTIGLYWAMIMQAEYRSLLLFDEPENSLHISLQKRFLEDAMEIQKEIGFQLIIATHSPTIINDYWDLVHSLSKRNKCLPND